MDTQPATPEYVKDLDALTRIVICQMLNIQRELGGDYITLAGLLNMSVIDIDTISAKENPANEVLTHWETKIYDATIPRLRELLLDEKMERNDIVDVLDNRRAAADDRPISDLRALTILKLCEILDIQVILGNDYRHLAAKFNMHINDIARISQKESGHTEAVLRWAGENRENTVGKLKEILVVMERDDCVQIINEDTERVSDSQFNEAYDRALRQGSKKNDRIPVMIIGQDRAGKTSLRKRLLGIRHDPDEPSTVGIHVDFVELSKSSSKEPWKSKEHKQFLASESVVQNVVYKEGGRILREMSQTEEQMEEPSQNVNEKQKCYFSEDPNPLSHIQVSATRSIEDDGDHSQGPESPASDREEDGMSEEKSKSSSAPESTIGKRPSAAEKTKMLFQRDVKMTGLSSTIRIVVHDLAGQAIYYDTHYLFLKPHCPYILVHDLTKPFDETAKPRFKPEFESEQNLNNPLLASNLEYLLLWLNVLDHLRESECQDGEKSIGFALPPVIVVLTNADRFEGNVEESKARITKVIEGKFHNVFKKFYVIDNTTASRKNDPINELRGEIFDICKAILEKEKPMPVSWLKFEAALSKELFSKSKRNYILVNEAEKIAGECKVESYKDALTFLHRQGVVVYYKECPYVVLNPPWLMNLFTDVITVPEESKLVDDPNQYKLREKGILMAAFLKEHPDGKLLEDVMQKASLMCSLEHERKPAFLVPSVAPFMKEGESVVEKLKKSPIASVFIIFLRKFLPPGVFTRLQVKFVIKCRDILRISQPKLFCNYTMLPVEFSDIAFDIYLIQLLEKIKIGIVPKAGIPNEECLGKFCALLKNLLKQCLDDIKSDEPLFYRGLEYEFGVKCTACVDETGKKPCRRHDKLSCQHDECAHMLSFFEIEKHPEKDVLCCDASVVEALEFDLKRVKPWMYAEKVFPNEDTRDQSEAYNSTLSTEVEEPRIQKKTYDESGPSSSRSLPEAFPKEDFCQVYENVTLKVPASSVCYPAAFQFKKLDAQPYLEILENWTKNLPVLDCVVVELNPSPTTLTKAASLTVEFDLSFDENQHSIAVFHETKPHGREWVDVTDILKTRSSTKNGKLVVDVYLTCFSRFTFWVYTKEYQEYFRELIIRSLTNTVSVKAVSMFHSSRKRVVIIFAVESLFTEGNLRGVDAYETQRRNGYTVQGETACLKRLQEKTVVHVKFSPEGKEIDVNLDRVQVIDRGCTWQHELREKDVYIDRVILSTKDEVGCSEWQSLSILPTQADAPVDMIDQPLYGSLPAATNDILAEKSKSVGMISLWQNGKKQCGGTAWILRKVDDVVHIMTNHHVWKKMEERRISSQLSSKVVIQFDYLQDGQVSSPEIKVNITIDNHLLSKDLDYAILQLAWPHNVAERKALPVYANASGNLITPYNRGNLFLIGHDKLMHKRIAFGPVLKYEGDLLEWLKKDTTKNCANPCVNTTKDTCGHTYKWNKLKNRKEFALPIELTAEHGTSGGPILNHNGEVVAMHTFALPQQLRKEKVVFGHPIQTIINDILKNNQNLAAKLFPGLVQQ